MEIIKRFSRERKRFLIPSIALVLTLATAGVIGLSGRIWAVREGMTRLEFSSALFCQRMSQAINAGISNGMADGSDCVNRILYVSSDAIENIQTLNIVPPEDGFGDIDWEQSSISISGGWTSAFYNLTSLSITGMHIQSITPLQGLAGNLTYLNLSDNNITDISPLAKMEDSLLELNLSGNPVSEGLIELSKFTELETLNMSDTGIVSFDVLFAPEEVEYDPDTSEPLSEEETSSKLAKVLRVLDISHNNDMSGETEELRGECNGNLQAFTLYANELVVEELYASNDNLNSDDLVCLLPLANLKKLDVSSNHIDDFSPIKTKPFSEIKADSQLFTRSIEGLDYEPLMKIFEQAQEEDYFEMMLNGSNTAITLDDLILDNAQFNGEAIRFTNAVIASESNDDPRPATVTIPAGTGAFENSKLQIFFAGQVVSFNDTNLCNRIYNQGLYEAAFIGVDSSSQWSPENPVVLTNACEETKQIAMISGGSDQFLTLRLDSVNNGEIVDLTGLEEFRGLEVLSLKNNGLTDMSKLSDANALQMLWLSDNNLKNDNWSVITENLVGLSLLDLNHNEMSKIPDSIGGLSNLGALYMVDNGISDVSPLSNAASISELDLSENELITDFSGMVQDESKCNPLLLKIENAGVEQLPDESVMAEFSNLMSLNLNGNRITSETIANLAGATRLDELYLNDNRIDDTSGFSSITKLKKLYLDNNRITDIDGLLPLVKLIELHLKDNKIASIAGLNTLPTLVTLDLRNQTLTSSTGTSSTYTLPAVFSQAKTMVFPNINGFQSSSDYAVENGTINYDAMTATMTNTSEPMVVTIQDGGLAGTNVTVSYGEGGGQGLEGIITDNTNSDTIITITSSNSFTITSDTPCMVLWTQDDGVTWNRLSSSTVAGNDNLRSFTLSRTDGVRVTIVYVGDTNGDKKISAKDVRKIINSLLGKVTLTSLEEKIADVDNNGRVSAKDGRAIINYILGKANSNINW